MYVENYFCRVSSHWWSTGVHRDPNAIAAQRATQFFWNTCQKMRGGKHVKVKKWRRQDILCFRANARKLILGSIGTPLDHLSVNVFNKAYHRITNERVLAVHNGTVSLRCYVFLCGLSSDMLFIIDCLKSISIFCQKANQCWLSKENISFCSAGHAFFPWRHHVHK